MSRTIITLVAAGLGVFALVNIFSGGDDRSGRDRLALEPDAPQDGAASGEPVAAQGGEAAAGGEGAHAPNGAVATATTGAEDAPATGHDVALQPGADAGARAPSTTEAAALESQAATGVPSGRPAPAPQGGDQAAQDRSLQASREQAREVLSGEAFEGSPEGQALDRRLEGEITADNDLARIHDDPSPDPTGAATLPQVGDAQTAIQGQVGHMTESVASIEARGAEPMPAAPSGVTSQIAEARHGQDPGPAVIPGQIGQVPTTPEPRDQAPQGNSPQERLAEALPGLDRSRHPADARGEIDQRDSFESQNLEGVPQNTIGGAAPDMGGTSAADVRRRASEPRLDERQLTGGGPAQVGLQGQTPQGGTGAPQATLPQAQPMPGQDTVGEVIDRTPEGAQVADGAQPPVARPRPDQPVPADAAGGSLDPAEQDQSSDTQFAETQALQAQTGQRQAAPQADANPNPSFRELLERQSGDAGQRPASTEGAGGGTQAMRSEAQPQGSQPQTEAGGPAPGAAPQAAQGQGDQGQPQAMTGQTSQSSEGMQGQRAQPTAGQGSQAMQGDDPTGRSAQVGAAGAPNPAGETAAAQGTAGQGQSTQENPLEAIQTGPSETGEGLAAQARPTAEGSQAGVLQSGSQGRAADTQGMPGASDGASGARSAQGQAGEAQQPQAAQAPVSTGVTHGAEGGRQQAPEEFERQQEAMRFEGIAPERTAEGGAPSSLGDSPAAAPAPDATAAGPAQGYAAASVASPEQFVRQAAATGAFEIELGRLALERAGSDDVRAFAERMIADHEQASRRLMEAAAAESLPAPAPEPTEEQRGAFALLRETPAEAFDAAYAEVQAWAHRDAIALFEAYGEREGPLGAFVHETLPVIRDHYRHVQELGLP